VQPSHQHRWWCYTHPWQQFFCIPTVIRYIFCVPNNVPNRYLLQGEVPANSRNGWMPLMAVHWARSTLRGRCTEGITITSLAPVSQVCWVRLAAAYHRRVHGGFYITPRRFLKPFQWDKICIYSCIYLYNLTNLSLSLFVVCCHPTGSTGQLSVLFVAAKALVAASLSLSSH